MDEKKRKASLIVLSGQFHVIEFAEYENSTIPAESFLESLSVPNKTKFLAIFQHVADTGIARFSNEDMFKREREFWAFKRELKNGPKGLTMARIVCFQYCQRLILTHGFWKPNQSKWPESEFRLAEKIKTFWLKKQGK